MAGVTRGPAAPTDAVVLAGGRGTRLRPLTLTTPKPLLPVAGVPFLEHPLSLLRSGGIRRVVLATSYRGEQFARLGDGRPGSAVECVTETEPMGTGGGLRLAAAGTGTENVVVLNGDLLCGLDIGELISGHVAREADVTLFLVLVADGRDFGSVTIDPRGRVLGFAEKAAVRTADRAAGVLVNGGCYVFRRDVVDRIPAGRATSLEYEVFPALIDAGARVFGHVAAAYWRDIGTPRSLVRTSADLVRGAAPSGALPLPTGESMVLEGASVDPESVLRGGTVVGRGCVIGPDACLVGSILFDDVRVGPGTSVLRSVLGRGVRVGRDCLVEDSVIGDGVTLAADNLILRGSRLWTGTNVSMGARRFDENRH